MITDPGQRSFMFVQTFHIDISIEIHTYKNIDIDLYLCVYIHPCLYIYIYIYMLCIYSTHIRSTAGFTWLRAAVALGTDALHGLSQNHIACGTWTWAQLGLSDVG